MYYIFLRLFWTPSDCNINLASLLTFIERLIILVTVLFFIFLVVRKRLTIVHLAFLT